MSWRQRQQGAETPWSGAIEVCFESRRTVPALSDCKASTTRGRWNSLKSSTARFSDAVRARQGVQALLWDVIDELTETHSLDDMLHDLLD